MLPDVKYVVIDITDTPTFTLERPFSTPIYFGIGPAVPVVSFVHLGKTFIVERVENFPALTVPVVLARRA